MIEAVPPAATEPVEGLAVNQLWPSSVTTAVENVSMLPLALLIFTICVSELPPLPVKTMPLGRTSGAEDEPDAVTVSDTVTA